MLCTCLVVKVTEKLKTLFGGLYTDENVLISGIHTHSGPAGYFQYVLFEVSVWVIDPATGLSFVFVLSLFISLLSLPPPHPLRPPPPQGDVFGVC